MHENAPLLFDLLKSSSLLLDRTEVSLLETELLLLVDSVLPRVTPELRRACFCLSLLLVILPDIFVPTRKSNENERKS
jgi:hypothetical protein